MPVDRFFTQGEEPADNRVVRADNRRQLQVPDRGHVYELLTPMTNSDPLVLKVRVPSGYSNASVPFNHHRAEECLFVLERICHLHVGDDDGCTLDAGDSITYYCDQPHWFRVLGDAEAVIIAAMTPPVFCALFSGVLLRLPVAFTLKSHDEDFGSHLSPTFS